jgi:hypothetical protein
MTINAAATTALGDSVKRSSSRGNDSFHRVFYDARSAFMPMGLHRKAD